MGGDTHCISGRALTSKASSNVNLLNDDTYQRDCIMLSCISHFLTIDNFTVLHSF